jgi:hypothetical protein
MNFLEISDNYCWKTSTHRHCMGSILCWNPKPHPGGHLHQAAAHRSRVYTLSATVLTRRPGSTGTRYTLLNTTITPRRYVSHGYSDPVRKVQAYPTEATQVLPAKLECPVCIGRLQREWNGSRPRGLPRFATCRHH